MAKPKKETKKDPEPKEETKSPKPKEETAAAETASGGGDSSEVQEEAAVQLYTEEDLQAAQEAAYAEGLKAGASEAKAATKAGLAVQCRDASKVKKGQCVQFWHPKNGATDELITAEVVEVVSVKGGHSMLSLRHNTKAGPQVREGVPYLSDLTMRKRTGRWFEFGRVPAKPKNKK